MRKSLKKIKPWMTERIRIVRIGCCIARMDLDVEIEVDGLVHHQYSDGRSMTLSAR